MRIALVAPLVTPISDRETPLGGAQAFVVDLARGLVEQEHEVVLLAADGSQIAGVDAPVLGIDHRRLTPARFDHETVQRVRTDLDEQTLACSKVRGWLDIAGDQIDAVHAHAYDAPAFTQLSQARQPVCHTLHLPPLDPVVTVAARIAATAPERPARLVTVSEANAAAWRAADVPLLDLEPALWDEVMSVNLRGAYLCCRAAFRQMAAQQPAGGSIVNLSSLSGVHGPEKFPGCV